MHAAGRGPWPSYEPSQSLSIFFQVLYTIWMSIFSRLIANLLGGLQDFMIGQKRNLSYVPSVGGDLNEIFYHLEKKEVPYKSQSRGEVVKEKLDHFWASTEWSLLFLNASVSHIESDIFDHLPILLKCSPQVLASLTRRLEKQGLVLSISNVLRKRSTMDWWWKEIASSKIQEHPDNFVGLLVQDILGCVGSFSLLSSSYVKRGENKFAHDIAYWQPLSSDRRLWVDDVRTSMLNQASNGLHTHIFPTLI
ncbi:hypothetical protein Cgig2_022151 [Carnegiea gigantea]|uniref:Uncharacterized protein n=1 Tax=Carnegiea gigantea TaxID=171969 RepID=A0A9Q1JJ54_9CARY|nr:hypothetical protein Cgig2_022151 [Carnegiea gigantea]